MLPRRRDEVVGAKLEAHVGPGTGLPFGVVYVMFKQRKLVKKKGERSETKLMRLKGERDRQTETTDRLSPSAVLFLPLLKPDFSGFPHV